MTQDTIVDFPEMSVGYVAGDAERPIHEQAPVAFRTLEASLPTLRRRRFFAALVGPEYRACVASEDGNTDPTLSRWVIPGGRYARRKIRDLPSADTGDRNYVCRDAMPSRLRSVASMRRSLCAGKNPPMV